MTSSSASLPTRLSGAGHLRAIAVLGLPLIGSNVAQYAVGLTDVIMLGWYDVTALAAGVLGSSIFFVFLIMGSGFAFGVMPMVASYAAQNDAQQVRRVTRMGLWLSLLFAAAVLPLFLVAEPILLAMGQQPDVADLTGQYLSIAGWGIVPALCVSVFKGYLSALEHARVVLLATISAVVVNAGLNYLLIFGSFGFPELGIRGAAIASLGVHLASLVVMAGYARRRLPEHALFQRFWRPDWEAFGRVFALGWPIGLTNLAETALFSASAIVIGWIGTTELATHGIVMSIVTSTFMIHLGLSAAATVRAGRAHGARDAVLLADGARMVIGVSIAVACVTIAAFLLFGGPLVGLFVAPDEPGRTAIIALGAQLLVVAALFQLADAGQVIALGLLRGVQDTRVPMVYAVLGYWAVGMPAGYLLGFVLGYGAPGVWGGLAFGLFCVMALMMRRFWRVSLPRVG